MDHLLGDLQKLWARYEQEYDITPVEFVGALYCLAYSVIESANHLEGDE